MSLNPFSSKSALTGRVPGRSPAQTGWVVFGGCVLIGALTLALHVRSIAQHARIQARRTALSAASSLEAQFSRLIACADVLANTVKQGNATATAFQTTAAELLASKPGVTSLEFVPSGIINDIAPRAGNERILGVNVLKAPARRAAAALALQKRSLTLSGPLPLYRGEAGIVATVPVYKPGADGKEAFWGFVAATMRLSDALARAHLTELENTYAYKLLVPGAGRKPLVISESGTMLLGEAVQQPVRSQELEFSLALRPHGGWIGKGTVIFESIVVLAFSILLGLTVGLWNQREQLATEASATEAQLAREVSGRKEAESALVAAEEKAAAAQASSKELGTKLQKVETDLRHAREEIEAHKANAEGFASTRRQEALQEEARTAARLSELERQLKAAEEAERVRSSQVDRGQSALDQAQQRIVQLQNRLKEEMQAKEAHAAAAQARTRSDQDAIAELRERLQAVERAAEETAAAHQAKLKELEESNRELKSRAKKTAHRDQLDLFKEEAAAPGGATLVEEEKAVPEPAQPAQFELEPVRSPDPAEPENEEAEENEARPEAVTTPRKTITKAETEKQAVQKAREPKSPHAAAPVEPVNVSEFRKVLHQIVPLLTDQDPGASDCYKANRAIFRSAFSAEAFGEFEQAVKAGEYGGALEILRKSARKHGITL